MLIAGNWKLYKGPAETAEFCRGLQDRDLDGVDVVVCPPYVSLAVAVQLLAGTEIAVAAQNVHWAQEGAYTGEVSPGMLQELGVYGAIVGHSERRQYFGETDETVARRVVAALEAGLFVIACVGESEEERESGQTELVLRVQVEAIAEAAPETDNLVIAYEPVWAIGTGKTATPELADGAHAFIKSILDVPVLYGGSVKPENAGELLAMPVDRRRARRGRLARSRLLHGDLRSGAPVALVILDGWGIAPPGPGNAVELADTPVFDRLWATYPHTTLEASGAAVGLPPGQMGNSEVGHLTIGSGRVLYQDLMRVNKGIEDGSFFENPALVSAFERGRNVHLLGLVSYGGVHSHIDHLRALLRFAPEKTWIHAFTDGRDVSPWSAVKDLAELPEERISSISGRYWAMDRDQRWERTQKAFEAITGVAEPIHDQGVLEVVQASYDAGVTDEFIEPVGFAGRAKLEPGDTVIFFNFRPDRGRQLSRLLLDARYDLTTMTHYADDIECPAVFGELEVPNTMAEVLAEHDLRQLHVAETEKYAHVTYFFNGGREQPWPGEERILVPSPREVGTYDQKPEMSAAEVGARFSAEIGAGHRFGVVNFANPDMVGHTGVIPAVVEAVQTTDTCLGQVVDAVAAAGGVCLITADHGNAEVMLNPDGTPQTAHTTSLVPLIVTEPGLTLDERGTLADLIPTALAFLGLPKPAEMSGNDLVMDHRKVLVKR